MVLPNPAALAHIIDIDSILEAGVELAVRLLRTTLSSKVLVDIILRYSNVMSSMVRRALGDISPRWDRIQGTIPGVRARLPVFT